MSYIGKTPVIGNFVKLDAISVVNGQAAYTMQNGGANFTEYNNVNQFLVSLNGILQSPTTSFTVSGSTITFASNLATGDVIDHIIVLGNTLDVGVPSDNTVSTAKLVDGSVTSAKLASGAGGKILQVISTEKNDDFSTSATSFTDVTGLSVSITPASTSNKILVMFSITVDNTSATLGTHIRLMRDSTEIAPARSDANYDSSWHKFYGDANISSVMAYQFLDSPSSSSALSYKLQIKPQSGTSVVNRSGSDNASQSYSHKSSSSITVMEISA